MVYIALTTEFAITAGVCDDRSGPDYQVVYLAALCVAQVGLVRGDNELHPVPVWLAEQGREREHFAPHARHQAEVCRQGRS
jgi:hypothetical protein